MENINDNDNDTNISFEIIAAATARYGELLTQPTSYYFASGQTAGVNLKIGSGDVHSVIFGSAANNAVVSLVDSIDSTTPVLWQYNATGALSVPIEVNFGGMPFSTGLRLVVTTGNASCTVVYE